jgi:hypothetical protein
MLLVAVPVAQPLPGDASQAVIEMTAYLEGRKATPPWRLLPLNQRPLVGRFLVPLRQLFVLVSEKLIDYISSCPDAGVLDQNYLDSGDAL